MMIITTHFCTGRMQPREQRLVAFTAEWQSNYGENYTNPRKVSEWVGRFIAGRRSTDDASSRHPAVII